MVRSPSSGSSKSRSQSSLDMWVEQAVQNAITEIDVRMASVGSSRAVESFMASHLLVQGSAETESWVREAMTRDITQDVHRVPGEIRRGIPSARNLGN